MVDDDGWTCTRDVRESSQRWDHTSGLSITLTDIALVGLTHEQLQTLDTLREESVKRGITGNMLITCVGWSV